MRETSGKPVQSLLNASLGVWAAFLLLTMGTRAFQLYVYYAAFGSILPAGQGLPLPLPLVYIVEACAYSVVQICFVWLLNKRVNSAPAAAGNIALCGCIWGFAYLFFFTPLIGYINTNVTYSRNLQYLMQLDQLVGELAEGNIDITFSFWVGLDNAFSYISLLAGVAMVLFIMAATLAWYASRGQKQAGKFYIEK